MIILLGQSTHMAVRFIARHLLALALVFAVVLPTLSYADIDVGPSPGSRHAIAAVSTATTDSAPVHHGCCCIETLQHCLYRHVETGGLDVVARPVQRAAFFASTESARSVGHDPLRRPPRA